MLLPLPGTDTINQLLMTAIMTLFVLPNFAGSRQKTDENFRARLTMFRAKGRVFRSAASASEITRRSSASYGVREDLVARFITGETARSPIRALSRSATWRLVIK